MINLNIDKVHQMLELDTGTCFVHMTAGLCCGNQFQQHTYFMLQGHVK